jgi:ketosteroid isomerase-like protein
MSPKPLLFVALFVSLLSCEAQDVEDQINKEVWYPFMESYAELDAEAFMDIHSANVLRINRDRGDIRTYETYAHDMAESFSRQRERGTKRTIEFSFLERIHANDVAYEVGYYRVRSAAGGQQQTYYGKFHVVLNKTDGRWKIAIDADSSQDPVIYEEDFMAGDILEK